MDQRTRKASAEKRQNSFLGNTQLTCCSILCCTLARHTIPKQKPFTTELVRCLDEVSCRLDEGISVDVCWLGFSRAFKLLLKLWAFALSCRLLKLADDFLIGQTFYIVVKEPSSDTSGVPQGSVPGAMLVLLLANDLARAWTSSFFFVDEIKVIGSFGWVAVDRDMVKLLNWE